jgi:hypothetical protein
MLTMPLNPRSVLKPFYFGLCVLLLTWAPARAGEGLLAFGLRGQGFIDLRPGNDYYLGPSLSYSNYHLFSHKLQLQATYLTNRPEATWRPGVPAMDWYLVTPLWHWRRNAFFDPTFQVDLGWAYFDDEGLGLDENNPTFIVAPAFGLNINLMQGQYGIHFNVGYQALVSSMVYPLVSSIQFWGML